MSTALLSLLAATVLAGCGGAAGGTGAGSLPATVASNTTSTGGSIQNGSLQALSGSSFGNYATLVAADQPAAFYRLNDAGGGSAADAAGGSAGALKGGVTPNAAAILPGDGASAMNFAGGYVKVAAHQAIQPASAITLEAWIQPTYGGASAQLGKIIADSRDWAAPGESYDLSLQSGKPSMSLVLNGVQQAVVAQSAVQPNVPSHLVGTYDGSMMRLYLNGTLVASRAASGSITNYTTDGLGIGGSQNGAWAFAGAIADVAIYPKALSLNRILMHQAAGGTIASYAGTVLLGNPVAYYRLNEAVGSGTAYDASPTSDNGSYGKRTSAGSTGLGADGVSAAYLGGGIISVPRSPALFPSSAITLEAVVSASAPALWSREVKIVGGGVPWVSPWDSYRLGLQNGKPFLWLALNGSGVQVVAPTAIVSGKTYHLAGTYDGSTMTIYVNGKAVATQAATGSIDGGHGGGMAIGGDIAGNWLYNGAVEDVAVYGTALGASTLSNHALLVPNLGAYGSAAGPTNFAAQVPMAATGANAITLSAPYVSLLSVGAQSKVTISESGYNGAFTEHDNCSGIAKISLTGQTVTAQAQTAGSCAVMISDSYFDQIQLPISVTVTAIGGS